LGKIKYVLPIAGKPINEFKKGGEEDKKGSSVPPSRITYNKKKENLRGGKTKKSGVLKGRGGEKKFVPPKDGPSQRGQ